ncbi:MAG TPA: lactonase family protein [Pyrinomonadaceae bacterium]|nr:lactonase family protein [Pyrinomonadaceae bacterium]
METKIKSRRQFLRFAGLSALGLSLQTTRRTLLPPPQETGSRLVYVGTYTTGRSEGIYVCRLDLSSGELRGIDVAKGVVNPSFLTIDRQRRYLYAVNEVKEFEHKATGAISSFGVDQRTGKLHSLNQQPSAGSGPCHLTLDATGKFLLVANYDGGSVAVLPVIKGSLGAPVDMVQHQGSSVNPDRQQGPHAHCVALDLANRYLFVTDLGLDKIVIYGFDSRSGKLKASNERWAKLRPGAGPRHFKFHPSGELGYVINELDSTITAFKYDGARGVLQEVQTVSTLPADFSGQNSCAEIDVAPSGKFLYGSNRGHDSIVVFSVNQRTGRLGLVQHVSTEGKTPRNFAIDPAGDFLLAANQNSNNVVTFRIDRQLGKLSPTGHAVEIPTPVCVVM